MQILVILRRIMVARESILWGGSKVGKQVKESLFFLHFFYMESFENMIMNSVLEIEVYSDVVWNILNFTKLGLLADLSSQIHLPVLSVFVYIIQCD
jgi:hypothetical protein